MDYLAELSTDEFNWMRVFTEAFYNCRPSDSAPSVPRAESYQLHNERRRDVYGTWMRVTVKVEELVTAPEYKSPRGEARKRRKRAKLREAG